MDATELELRRRISALEEKVEKLGEKLEDYNLNEYLRKYLVSIRIIEGAAEDE